MPLNNASVTTNSAKLEAVVKSPDGLKMTFTWPTPEDLHNFKAAFDFANRVIDSRFKTVSHRLLTRRQDSEIVFGFDKATGEHAAIKVLSKDRAHNRTIAECEVAIRMSIDHRAIVKTVDVFETPFDLFIVMAYMDGGSLANRIISRNHPPITEHEARIIMARLFAALGYLHARGIVHRNVKPENILLEHAGEPRWPDTVRLNDFAKACFLYPELAPSAEAADFANQVVGSPDYLAPEAAVMIAQADGSRRPCIGPETDMWAAGVTLYNILSHGSLPFDGATTPEVLRNARHSAIQFHNKEAFLRVSEAAISLIRALLNPDRRKRPTAESVFYHPWFDNFDPHLPGPVMRDPPLVGYQKFRVAATSVRFTCRLRVNTPGLSKAVCSHAPAVSRMPTSSSKIMRFVSMVAPVNVSPIGFSTTKGVDIAPYPAPRVFQQPPPTAANMGYHGGVGIPGQGVPPSGPASGSTPVQFTTSTLSPTDGLMLRTSQTSSAGSHSFRSSHDSSRIVPADDPVSLQQMRQRRQAEQARDQAQMELQHQRELALRAQQAGEYDRRVTEQHTSHMDSDAHLQSGPPPYLNATPRNGAGGLIGGLIGAMRRDASPATSNPGSRAASNLGGIVGNAPNSGGEVSMDSTRSHMQTCGAATREESCAGDESMGSCSSSQTGSNRSMQPLSDSRPGSDLQMMAGCDFGDASVLQMAIRGDSAVELADLAPELTLSAGIMPSGEQNMSATHGTGHSLRYHSSGKSNLQQHSSPVQNAMGLPTVFPPDVEERNVQGTPSSKGKKRSVRKKFDGLRNATHGQFTGFGVYNGSKDKG